MEEIKTKKKLNKKPLIICLALAIVFGLIGFIDIKSNASELYTVNYKLITTNTSNNEVNVYTSGTLTSSSPIYFYYYNIENSINGRQDIVAYPMSRSDISGNANGTRTLVDKNGDTWYYCWALGVSTGNDNFWGTHIWDIQGAEKMYKLNNFVGLNDFVKQFANGSLDSTEIIDYDNLPIDDDMLIPENLKRNVITNEDLELGDFRGAIQRYDYITWRNTSEVYQLELQVMPVVQYFQMKLNENKFTKEFYGEWITQEIFDEVTNSYTICTYSTDLSQPVENKAYVDGLNLKSECDDKYSKGFLEENYLIFAYRIRYVDVENEKAGCWLTLVPSNEFDSYDVYVEYSDSSLSDKTDGNGLHNEYTNLEDIENAKTDITTENDFKDKYGVTSGDVDTSQATNWLYSVVDFIKTTPQMVGVVLAFLPQPILYGMYITIFLGCIASTIAIVKALI